MRQARQSCRIVDQAHFRRVPAPLGGYDTLAPDELRLPPGSVSSMGTFLYRVVGLFRTLVVTAHAPVSALVGEDPAGPCSG